VRDFVRIFAPRRGEIVVDAAALELGPPRPPRPARPPRPRRGAARLATPPPSNAADEHPIVPVPPEPTAEPAAED
jgi:hypothetical protein